MARANFGVMTTNLLSRARHWTFLRLLVEVAALVIVVVVTLGLASLVIPPPSSPRRADLVMIRNLVEPALLLLTYGLTVRWLERRPVSELHLRHGGLPLLAGAAIGAVMMATVYLILWGLGLASFGPGTGLAGIGHGLASALGAAVFEELLLRAVLFRILDQAFGTTTAVAASAVIFGLLHGLNPGATPMSLLAIALEAGVLLALAYALTRNLWLAVGVHFGWNFAEGSLFGAQVSGSASTHGLVHAGLTGPPLLTGGAFGPEASVVSIGVSLVVATVFGVLILRRGGWTQRGFRLRLA